jgi:Na+-transporting NADH:ubiquinone oxidoreductase subunit C
MAFGNAYVFGFATAICVVASLSVSSVHMGLKDLQDANARRDVQKNILLALGLPEDGGELEGEAVDQLFDSRVKLQILDSTGAVVEGPEHDLDGDGSVGQGDADLARAAVKGTKAAPKLNSVYVRVDGSAIAAIAIPVHGNGLWGPISGYIALDPGATKVVGTTFFAPKETPGLGAEITETKFEAQWLGKRIVDDGKARTVRVVKGKATNLCRDSLDFCVDGVSGATITSRGVDEMVASALKIYDPFLRGRRGPQGGR